uniref:Uncharacterized protein n=1 Tax=Acrobeloides nanus TaxID=290746 RepID=A0A914CIT8_9BILA
MCFINFTLKLKPASSVNLKCNCEFRKKLRNFEYAWCYFESTRELKLPRPAVINMHRLLARPTGHCQASYSLIEDFVELASAPQEASTSAPQELNRLVLPPVGSLETQKMPEHDES